MSRPAPDPLRRLDHQGPAPLHQGHALLVHVRPRDLARSPDAHVVRALRTSAAEIERHEQVVPSIVPNEERRLDRPRHRRRLMRPPARPARQRIQRRIFARQLARLRIDPPHLDPAPETPPVQPDLAVRVHENIAVDRVPVVLALRRTHHHAPIHPLILRAVRIERLVHRQPDRRAVLAERRNRVVQVILPVEERNIRRPDPPRPRNLLRRPLRKLLEHVPDHRPVP